MYYRCNDHGIDFEGCYVIVCSYLNISYIRYAGYDQTMYCTVFYDVLYRIVTRQRMIRSSDVKCSVVQWILDSHVLRIKVIQYIIFLDMNISHECRQCIVQTNHIHTNSFYNAEAAYCSST